MAVDDGIHIGAHFENFAVDEALQIGFAATLVDHVAVEVAGQDVVGLHQGRGHAAGNEKALRVGRVAHADVAKAVEHTLVDQDVVGQHQVVNEGGVGMGAHGGFSCGQMGGG